MKGGYLDLANGVTNIRGVYMHTTVERFALTNGVKALVLTGRNGIPVNNIGQDYFGLSINADYDNWLIRSEMNYLERSSVKNTYTTQSYSGGYQSGDHTVMLTWSQFRERAKYWSDATERHTTKSLSYRWDFTKSQALKVQFDHVSDESKILFTGNANLLSASWQFLF